MSRRGAFVVGAVVSLLQFAASSGASECGGTTECDCGDRVISDYVLPGDLGPCEQHGLEVDDGVTLDGDGHAIVGDVDGAEFYGVYVRDASDATVRNVVVSGFYHGIRLRDAHRCTIVDNESFDNGDFDAQAGYGIDVAFGSSENHFEGNSIHDNADEGIHFGTGSGDNVFVDNEVYDNFRENVYLLSADGNTFTDNRLSGGRDSFFVKDSSDNRFERNVVADARIVLRGGSLDNVFVDNEVSGAGFHFEIFTEETPFRSPSGNLVIGGEVEDAARCLQFTGSSGNRVVGTHLKQCDVDVSSDASDGAVDNTLIGVEFDEENVALDTASLLRVGWRLDVHVQDPVGQPIEGAIVAGFDVASAAIFVAATDASGDLPTQEVIAYVRQGDDLTPATPILLTTTALGFPPDSREVSLDRDEDEIVVLGALTQLRDLAILRISPAKHLELTDRRPTPTRKVAVTIQNQGRETESIPDAAALGRLVRLEVASLNGCPDPTAVLFSDKQKFPLEIRSKRTAEVLFEVEFSCSNDPLRSTRRQPDHEDFRYGATLAPLALDGIPDADPFDDVCPRSVTPPFRPDPYPDGKLKDRGCGSKGDDRTFGEDVLSDVIDHRSSP
jgi:parallel beta-helix repeat protein